MEGKIKYRVTIEVLEPFKVTRQQYEGTDGKLYHSRYGLPEGVKYKEVQVPTGEMGMTEVQTYRQIVDDLEIEAVIRAVNGI